MIFVLTEEFKQDLIGEKSFNAIMNLKGKKYRELENRLTQKIEINNKSYFIKHHYGVGWKEIFKNLFQLRFPVLGAKNEWQALQRLHQLGITVPTLAGYGISGFNPAKLASFVITKEVNDVISLEDFCKNWQKHHPSFKLKYTLLKEVAKIARVLHENGLNHRDMYLCHFLMAADKSLYLIDLHRAQIHRHLAARWIIKDLAGLYFSSKDIGLTQRDLLRFMKHYRARPLRQFLNPEQHFWLKVKKRGDKLYKKHSQ